MKANFSPRHIYNLKAQSATGKMVDITIFSEYRPEDALQKVKDIWAVDILRINDENEVMNFSYGSEFFIHPKTKEKYIVHYQ